MSTMPPISSFGSAPVMILSSPAARTPSIQSRKSRLAISRPCRLPCYSEDCACLLNGAMRFAYCALRGTTAPSLGAKVNDEARSDRHFGCGRCRGHGECPVVSPLRPCSPQYLARLHPPKRLCSPGRSAHGLLFQPKQSGSHRRRQSRLQFKNPLLTTLAV